MADSAAVNARIDPRLKARAESILAQLGVTPSGAIQMFYSQIVLRKGLPFDLKLPDCPPLDASRVVEEALSFENNKEM